MRPQVPPAPAWKPGRAGNGARASPSVWPSQPERCVLRVTVMVEHALLCIAVSIGAIASPSRVSEKVLRVTKLAEQVGWSFKLELGWYVVESRSITV